MATPSTEQQRNLTVIETGGSPESANDDLVNAVKRYLDAALFPLRAELLAVKTELEALKSIPQPQPGRDGLPGAPGRAGRDGRDGAPGADGLGIDDMQMDFDGERRVTFKFIAGERVKTFPTIVLPSLIYRNIYREGVSYERFDTCTYAGCLWFAKTDTTEKPGAGCKDWQLICKRGADGKNGKSAYDVAVAQGFKGSQSDWLKSLKGPPGPPGRDLRHLG